jgi:tetratricopeptide (TPR) repeat protein
MSSETVSLLSKEELIKKYHEEKLKYDSLLKQGKYDEAINGYNELIKTIKEDLSKNKALEKEDKDLIKKEFIIASYSNISFCYIKLKDWNSVIKYSTLILKSEKENIKALYRKCFAEINSAEYDKAQITLNMLYKLIGDNPEIEGLRKTLDEKKTWDNLQKMKKYKKMMNCYHKLNEEKEYQEMSKIGKFFFNCKQFCSIIFCCCNKRKTIKKEY